VLFRSCRRHERGAGRQKPETVDELMAEVANAVSDMAERVVLTTLRHARGPIEEKLDALNKLLKV